ncbi:hypothetical protein MNB_SUP05-SYMBIONT-4-1027 [hydrothermal vent metagenome]|uniref:Uncharacterized protein n=1 Tax=hydrothermal vent metagenome TaxID=652676 RepID=A0A1W1DYD4_9ZZZZ
MNLPTQESIKFAQESAKKIIAVKIEAETFMDFDADYQNFNKVDRGFMQDLIERKDLSEEYIRDYMYG